MVELLALKTSINGNNFRQSVQRSLSEEKIKMIKSGDQEGGLAVEMKEEDICTAKSQMGEVKEENEKLKQLISNVVKDYKSLQTHFFQVLQHDEAKNLKTEELDNTLKDIKEDPLLVSLSLGRTSSIDSSSESIKEGKRGFDALNKGLSLGLDSFEEPKKQETIPETWPPSKVLKTIRSSLDEERPFKKARVSIRARCDSQTMNDGCHWRKYGQKVAKGNPCPRAYYRCTISPTCPVRKQVQRCAEDMSILVTTYEGTHNHPLPPSATAMASTTSAAVAMLKSHSSQSKLGSSVSAPLSNSTITTKSSALNFSSCNWNQDQFSISKTIPSMSTLNSHPTITLDLTNNNPSQYSNPKFPSSTRSFSPSRTTLNFSSNSSSQLYNFNTTSWNSSAYNYDTILQHGTMGNSLRKQQDVYKPYNMQMANTTTTSTTHNQQESLKESIAAATKMIASNPNFQSALAAAISSYVGCKGGNVRENHGLDMDHSTLNLNFGDGPAHS